MTTGIAVGVDAGGTTTTAALSRDGVFEMTSCAGAANATSRGVDVAAEMILAVIRAATGGAEPAALYVGAAGAGRADVSRELEGRLRGAFPAVRLVVADDTAIALRRAIPEGPGIVLIAGTGSVAYAEHASLRVRIGGAGFLLGDEGSGFALGFAAMKHFARTFDGRAAADELTAMVAGVLHVNDRDALLATVYDAPLDVMLVASLAPHVIALAGGGNRPATKIVQQAAIDLAELARAAARQTNLTDASPPIALAGGLLQENNLLTFLLETRLVNDLPGSFIVRARDDAARAALHFAEMLLRD